MGRKGEFDVYRMLKAGYDWHEIGQRIGEASEYPPPPVPAAGPEDRGHYVMPCTRARVIDR